MRRLRWPKIRPLPLMLGVWLGVMIVRAFFYPWWETVGLGCLFAAGFWVGRRQR